MTAERRRLILLAALALVAALAGWRYVGLLGSSVSGEALALLPAARADDRSAGSELDTEVAELDLAMLQGRSGRYQPGRDPWKFFTPPPPPPRGPSPEERERMQQEAARRAAERETPTVVVEQKPKPPSVDVNFLGSFGPPDRRIAVFSDGEAIYNALAGDVLEEKFIVAGIGYESVDLSYVDFPELPPKRLAVGE
jgi:hypothetical protein